MICIGTLGGRVGSSMIMGLLQKSGIDTGKTMTEKSPMNEKGFFEILEFQRWFRAAFTDEGFDEFMPPVPTYETIKRCDSFDMKWLDKYFTSYPRAIKCPYVFTHRLFDCEKLVWLKRSIPAQAASQQKWNSKEGDFVTWLEGWYLYTYHTIGGHYPLWFEDFQDDPYGEYVKLMKYLECGTIISEQEVMEWYDPKLVHYGNNQPQP